ncbi:NUDIX domain-containing protein [Empedobacter falsenii]
MIRINGKYLLVKNNRNEWELPGGRLEPNELPEETLEREIYEELNIKCKVQKLLILGFLRLFQIKLYLL